MTTAKEKREERARAIAETNKQAIIHPDKVADAHGEIARPSSAGAKVIVACKLGVAYFSIQLCKMETKFEQNMQGGREVKESTRIGEVVRLRGTAYPRGTPPEGFPERPEIVAGAALNYGIDRDWFNEWLKQNHLNPLVMNKMIFAHEKLDGVRGIAKETAGVQSGLEPISPKKDPRITRSTRSEVSDIETEESRAKKQREEV